MSSQTDRPAALWRVTPDVARPLRAAGLCVVGLGLTWVLAALVPATHIGDASALNGFTALSRPRVDLVANDLLSLLAPFSYTLLALALIVIALARRRPRVALACALVLALAPLSAEVLKPLLAHEHAQVGWSAVGQASWPSGHSTAAMALALCAMLVSARHWRPTVAALGSLFAVGVGFSLLILAWHLPSDVFGGYLLAAMWASLAVAGLRAWELQRPRSPAPASVRRFASRSDPPFGDLVIPSLIATSVLCAAAAVLLLRTSQVASFAADHRPVIVAAVGIASLAILISSSLTLVLRR